MTKPNLSNKRVERQRKLNIKLINLNNNLLLFPVGVSRTTWNIDACMRLEIKSLLYEMEQVFTGMAERREGGRPAESVFQPWKAQKIDDPWWYIWNIISCNNLLCRRETKIHSNTALLCGIKKHQCWKMCVKSRMCGVYDGICHYSATHIYIHDICVFLQHRKNLHSMCWNFGAAQPLGSFNKSLIQLFFSSQQEENIFMENGFAGAD